MERIIAAGPGAIPVLIRMLTDGRELKTASPIICYFQDNTVGGLAFCLLNDLFTDGIGRSPAFVQVMSLMAYAANLTVRIVQGFRKKIR